MTNPNVIVLIFDTLRSDYLGCYGADTETSAIDAAADMGVLFESAFAAGPATPVSHAALYSGQYPSETGVTGQYIPIPENIPLIASWLHDVGYDTFGITGPSKMGSDWGYDRGFRELYEPHYNLPSNTSMEALTKAVTDSRFRDYFIRKLTKGGWDRTRFKFELLQNRVQNDLNRPFFALCNFLTTHAKYDPPRPYKMETTSGFSRPRWNFIEFLFDRHGKIESDNIRLERVMDVQNADGIGRYLANPDYLNESEEDLLREWYAATVEYLDDEFRNFLEFYHEELQDDTILILTTDHGEQLGEHGLWEHSHYLYDETLKVPLILLGPGVPEGQRRTDLASLVDIFDTICDLCDISPPETTSGQSLFGGKDRDAVFMEYGERDAEEFKENSGHGRYLTVEQLERFSAGRKGIRTHEYRFEITSNGTEHLYKLPEQVEVEINSTQAKIADHLRKRLLETLGENYGTWPEGDPETFGLTNRVEENLRQLGYID